ncbi:MAG TPA: suppressor of fused domain protein [Pyrinomonadaceae bacterium]|nr:suppressor of fused domain protein [Pyrinomonadaceae bacterium]
MGDDEKLVSMSGSPIYVHKERERSFKPAASSEDGEQIEKHIERYLGPIEWVWHEIVSDLVHLDVQYIKPTPERNVHTLVSTGMSDLPMSPPAGAEGSEYAELLITLPAEWPVSEEDFKNEKDYWPVGLLKWLARFPHEYETWLWWGHTVPNGNPPEPYHPSTKFAGAILAPPVTVSQEFLSFKCRPDKEVSFFSVIPLYPEEMDLKLRKGSDALFDLFDKSGVNEIIDVHRKNVAKKWWRIG